MDAARPARRANGRRLRPATAALAPLLAGCGRQSAHDPAGPVAAVMAEIGWVMYAAATAISLLVVALLAVALLRGWRRPDEPGRLPVRPVTWIVAGGVVLPVVVLVALYLYAFRGYRVIAAPPVEPAVTIEVVGRMWWWDVRYLDDDPARIARTANEIHIPVGRPVRLRLASQDVIHSFWIPQLHGKMDMIPGRTNELWLQADRAGVYRGQCAEYCGVQHTHMGFLVIAEPPGDFEAWLALQREPAREPTGELTRRGRQVFLGSGCPACHVVRGTQAFGRAGPDLTHMASRRTLAAAMLPNTRGHLGGWIAGTQSLKPGNLMPSMNVVDGAAFQALLAYLESLE